MRTMTLKSKGTARAEDTRRKIYEAAMELFREKGFEQTTMRDIAAQAGVALGGAYYYFSSKDAIVLAFYAEMQQAINQPVLEALAGRKSFRAIVAASGCRSSSGNPPSTHCDGEGGRYAQQDCDETLRFVRRR